MTWCKIFINGSNQPLQDEIEFVPYLITYKQYNLADVLVTQISKNITKDHFFIYNNIFDIWTNKNQNLQMMICQCALNSNIVIADTLFQKMPLPDEIPLQSHYLTHVPYIYTCVY